MTALTPDHSARRVKLLVWLTGALAVAVGAVTLAIVSLRLDSVKAHHARSEAARDTVALALQDLRDYRVSMTGVLSGLRSPEGMNCPEPLETPTQSPAPFRKRHVADSIERARRAFEELGGTQGDDLQCLVQLEKNLQAVHEALSRFCRTRAAAEASTARVSAEADAARRALAAMRTTIAKATGRHRLTIATGFAALNRGDDDRVEALEELTSEMRKAQAPRLIRDDLADLALMTEQLLAAQGVDGLRSLKDNRIRQSLSRIRRNSVRLPEDQTAFRDQTHELVERLFGAGAMDDPQHQTMLLGSEGLYQECAKLIKQRHALRQITLRTEALANACRDAERQTRGVLAELSARMRADLSGRLQAASNVLFWVSGGAIAVVLFGNFWIVGLISRAMHQSAEMQRESMEMAQLIRESPNEVYIFRRVTLRFLEVNKGACQSTGYNASELLGMTPIDLQPGLVEDSFRRSIAPLFEGRTQKYEYQAEQRRITGDFYPVQVSLHAATFGDEDVYVAFVNDLTEVRALEKQLSQAQKLESIGQLAAGIAHEINTPMQFVRDNLEFLSNCSGELLAVLESYRGMLDSDQPIDWDQRRDEISRIASEHRYDHILEQLPAAIEESRAGVQRTVKIVRAMKEFSHPGVSEQTVSDLNKAIESTVAISRNRWKYTAELRLELDRDLPEVPLFVSEINQVLLNLVVNASDAIADRNADQPGELGRIEVRTSFDDEYVQVEVTDDGCGIPDEIKDRVFDPFFTTKEVGKGTGQGLSISHNVVVNQHGGHIEIDSDLGVGTTFRIRLPRRWPQDGGPAGAGADTAPPAELVAGA